MKKLIIWILVVLIAISFIAIIKKDAIIKAILINGTKSFIGLELSLDEINVNISDHNIKLENLKVYNPAGFKKEVMLNVPLIYIDYDLNAILKGQFHLYALKIEAEKILIERNKKGHLNFMSIRELKKSPKSAKGPKPAFKIDKLYLSMGKVVYKDYFKKTIPSAKIYNVGLRNQLFENVNSPRALISAIMYKTLMQTDIYELINFNTGILKENLGGVIDSGGSIVKEFKSLSKDLPDINPETIEGLKNKADDIQNTLKNIFNKE